MVGFLAVAPVPPAGAVGALGEIRTFTRTGMNHPEQIVTGPDGNLWFTDEVSNKIGRVTPNGTITMFSNSNIDTPVGITAGPDGALWFTNLGNNRLGRVTT